MLYIWICIILLLTILEIMTINLTTIWYILGSVLALIVSFLTDNFFIQFGVFIISGTLAYLCMNKYIKSLINSKSENISIDSMIGMNGIVTKDVLKNNLGEVKVNGKKISAKASKNINKNSIVKILSVDGNTLVVESVEE